MIRKRVVFPHPDGPMKETKSPAATCKLTLDSASTVPSEVSNVSDTSRTSMASTLSRVPACASTAMLPRRIGSTAPILPAGDERNPVVRSACRSNIGMWRAITKPCTICFATASITKSGQTACHVENRGSAVGRGDLAHCLVRRRQIWACGASDGDPLFRRPDQAQRGPAPAHRPGPVRRRRRAARHVARRAPAQPVAHARIRQHRRCRRRSAQRRRRGLYGARSRRLLAARSATGPAAADRRTSPSISARRCRSPRTRCVTSASRWRW